jgi:hypothetical protein
MRGKDIYYLEAPTLTQELLNIKWALLSSGFRIGSTWHDGQGSLGPSFKDHWAAKSLEELHTSDSLVVICGKNDAVSPELALMAGLALAQGLEVIWIGPPGKGLSAFRAFWQFNTADDYQKDILQKRYSHSAPSEERIAA